MATRSVDPTPFAEDWSSYRKLVVDTLRRLDERTIEIYDKMTDLSQRVTILEQNDNDKEIERLEDRLTKLDDEYKDFKSEVSDKMSTTKGVLWAFGVGWTAITVIAQIVISIVVK